MRRPIGVKPHRGTRLRIERAFQGLGNTRIDHGGLSA
jgi:hypothetical protein